MRAAKLTDLDASVAETLSDDELRALTAEWLDAQEQLRREAQIRFYQPVSERARTVHHSTAEFLGIGGGKRASKTETALAEAVALATGIFPQDPDLAEVFRAKFRGPIKVRVIVESHTTTLVPTILPKLQWWTWSGMPPPGGPQGHWGWIPKHCLINADWSKSWQEKLRILRVRCYDPDDPQHVLGDSSFQFMSHSQDWSDFASGEYHIVIVDEPTRYAIWRENVDRVRSVNGRIILAMTWPDEPGIPMDWIYDEIYDKAQPGPGKSNRHDWFELWTTENPHLDQDRVGRDYADASEMERRVKFLGQPIRFSNRIHPLFTDAPQHWCFRCGRSVLPERDGRGETICGCGSYEIVEFCHVTEFETAANWPAVFLLDPHPRRPHMFMWVQIDPADDLWVVADGECEEDPVDVRMMASQIEESLGFSTSTYLMDPNMGASPASARRNVTWQDEFAEAGLPCDLADDSDVGRKRVNEFLRPDTRTWRPRLHVHLRCQGVIYQMKRYTWDEHRYRGERELKQTPRPKYDDYPSLLKYLMNYQPQFGWLHRGPPTAGSGAKRRGAY